VKCIELDRDSLLVVFCSQRQTFMRSVSLTRTDDLEKGCKCIMQLYEDSERSMNCWMQQKLEQRLSSVCCSLGDLCDEITIRILSLLQCFARIRSFVMCVVFLENFARMRLSSVCSSL
jgi:hypothetical protein